MLDYLRSTRFKLQTAHVLYRLLRGAGFAREQAVSRGGVRYALDLAEGIDLAVFLFGGFQRHISANRHLRLREDALIIDVGANCGAIALSLAQRHPRARVHAIEPTDFAIAKLRRNIGLNPHLAPRVHAHQFFIAGPGAAAATQRTYASWRVDTLAGERHRWHLGIPMASAAEQLTLDEFLVREGIERVDFVKIDTDGNELAVLAGMGNCLAQHRPALIFELSTHQLATNGECFAQYASPLHAAGYRLFRSGDMRPVDAENLDRLVPPAGSIDVLALPCS